MMCGCICVYESVNTCMGVSAGVYIEARGQHWVLFLRKCPSCLKSPLKSLELSK